MSVVRNEKQTSLDINNIRANQQIERRQKDKQILQVVNKKNHQISILHEINSRLGAQLILLQKKLGIDHDYILKELENLNEISVAFHFQTDQLQYLDSLLNAYDENNIKQKKMIAMLYSSLEDAEKRAENLVRDNEYLLLQNQNKCKKILQIYHKGNPEQSLVPSYRKLQREMQAQKNQVIREENEHLLCAFRDLEHRYDNLEKQFNEQKFSCEKYLSNYKKQTEQYKDALINIDNLVKIKEVLEKKLNEVNEQNIELEMIKNQLDSRVSKLESSNKMLKSQINNQKRDNFEDTQRISNQLQSLKTESQNAISRQRETFNRMMILEKQVDDFKNTNRSLRRQNQKIKSDNEQALKMCDGYESRISSLSRKEENTIEILNQYKEKFDNLLLEKDKALMKCEQYEKFINNLNEKHKDEMTTIRLTFEKIINSQNQKIRDYDFDREDNESLFVQEKEALKHQLEKVKRQNHILQEENARLISNIKVSSGSEIISKLKELQDKNQSLTRLLNQKERNFQDQKQYREEIIKNLENQNRNLNRLYEKQKNNAMQLVREVTQQKSKNSILKNEKQCNENEISKLKRNMNSNSSSKDEEKQWRIKEMQQRVEKAEKKEKATREKAIQMLERYDQAQQKLKNEYQTRIQQLELENQNLRVRIRR